MIKELQIIITMDKETQDVLTINEDAGVNMIEDKLTTVKDVADYLILSEEEVKEMLEQEGIPIICSGNSIQVYQSDIDAYLEEHTVTPTYYRENQLLTVKDVAMYLHINKQEAEEILEQEDMPILRFGDSIRIIKYDLDVFLEEHSVEELLDIEDKLMTVKDVAEYLCINKQEAEEMLEQEGMPIIRSGDSIQVYQSDIEAYLAERQEEERV